MAFMAFAYHVRIGSQSPVGAVAPPPASAETLRRTRTFGGITPSLYQRSHPRRPLRTQGYAIQHTHRRPCEHRTPLRVWRHVAPSNARIALDVARFRCTVPGSEDHLVPIEANRRDVRATVRADRGAF